MAKRSDTTSKSANSRSAKSSKKKNIAVASRQKTSKKKGAGACPPQKTSCNVPATPVGRRVSPHASAATLKTPESSTKSNATEGEAFCLVSMVAQQAALANVEN